MAARTSLEVVPSPSFCEMGELPPLGSKTDEEFPAFVRRVSDALGGLAVDHEGETLVVVCHAGVIVASLVCLLDIPRPGTGSTFEPDYCSVTEWEHRAGGWVLRGYNVRPGAYDSSVVRGDQGVTEAS